MSNPSKSRIAISFNSVKSTKSSSNRSNLPPSNLGKRSRSSTTTTKANAWAAHNQDSDSDDAEDTRHSGKHEAITAFGAEGAIDERIKKEEPKQYVIPRQPNADWKATARAAGGKKNLLPEEARAAAAAARNAAGDEADVDTGESGIKWGLTVPDENPSSVETETINPTTQDPNPNHEQQQAPPTQQEPEKTADQEAMDALLGIKPTKSHLSIPSETDAYRTAISTAGEASTLADYEAMPVEEFGAALLRGMGWNGKERGSQPRAVKRRPNRLGLGAKELKDAEELGMWNQGGSGGGKKRPKLADYRREQEKKKEARRRNDDDRDERREREKRYGQRDGRSREDGRYDDRERDRYSSSSGYRDRHRDRR